MATSVLTPDHGTGNTSPGTRIRSIDLLRGAVMLLMAIDHVRVYSGIPSFSTDPGIFFTRWVTHFCVPAFVFFAGTSAFLYNGKLNNQGKLARYLLTRGILLVLLELTLIRFFWTFNLNFGQFTLAGVIWMLGWCMIILAVFVRLSPRTIGITGICIVALQQLFSNVPLILPADWRGHFGWFWEFIYPSGGDWLPHVTILYVIVPWIGVMMAGYGFGKILISDPVKRLKCCLWIGLSFIAAFLIIGSLVIYFGSPNKNGMPFIFRLLGQQKYPASQLYLLMTLGPVIALIPFAETAKGWLAGVLNTFGRVPLFYYLLHILLIHVAALLVNYIREGNPHQDWYGTAPYTEIAPEHHWGLPLLYLVFIILEVLLYFVCRQYMKYKFAHPEKKWLKYI
jgi:uncharacterized membrane protein